MQLSNNPDIALAQEWILALDRWIDQHGLAGYDPFDIKQHPWIRAAQPYRLARRATTGLCDVFPVAMRRLLGVAKTENPKAHALVALGKLRLFQYTGQSRYLDEARVHLAWLVQHASPGWSGLCWGYPFDVTAKGLHTPAGTPVLVISAIAGQAFLLAHAVTGEQVWLENARSVATFIRKDLPPMPEGDGMACIPYTPGDFRRVHNANLLGAQHLIETGVRAGDAALVDYAEPMVRFTLSRQHEDGSWFYGEYRADEPYEREILEIVDEYHTGFVLRSLHAIAQATGREDCRAAVKSGFAYFKNHLHEGSYFMPVNSYGRYPVDIHACAEAVLCPSVLKDDVLAARGMPSQALKWPHWYLRDHTTHVPLYRKYPWFTARIYFPRWGGAWMYYAMAEMLYRHREKN